MDKLLIDETMIDCTASLVGWRGNEKNQSVILNRMAGRMHPAAGSISR
jgi:hypothetical protein